MHVRQLVEQRLVPAPRSISMRAFSVPTRQGVHWPQLSSSKKRIRLQRGFLHVVLVGEDHDRRRADEAAVLFERAEIERDVGHARRQDAARRAARQVGRECVPVAHPAAKLVDQLAHGDARRRELHAGILDSPRDGRSAQALAAVAALRASTSRRRARRCRGPSKASRRC